MLQGVTGLPSKGGDFPPLLPQLEGKGTRREGISWAKRLIDLEA